jgi:predicted dinucleotide-binding enzyme
MQIRNLIVTALAILVLCSDAVAQRPTVAIIGTGSMASAMGPNLARKGYTVVYGSRDPDRQSVRDLVARTGPTARGVGQAEAAAAGDVVVLAVPWEAMRSVVENLGDVSGKVLFDFSASDRPGADGYMESGVETSTSQLIQGWVPDALVVKTLVPSVYLMADPTLLGDPPTVMLASDSRYAKEVAGRVFYDMGLDPFDAGPLRNAQALAAFGRIFWVPLLQGREQGIEIRLMRSSYWPCSWDVQATFGPASDADDLAELPGQGAPQPCESFRGR